VIRNGVRVSGTIFIENDELRNRYQPWTYGFFTSPYPEARIIPLREHIRVNFEGYRGSSDLTLIDKIFF
jgi:hypothetical protein